jgi:hypothetical protein
VKNNFDLAIHTLIHSLVGVSRDMKLTQQERNIAHRLLAEWDCNRGDDWYTSTKRREIMLKEKENE